MVTNVSATPVSISYYGRLTNTAEVSSTSSTMLLPPPAEAQNYYKSPENLSGTVNNMVTASNSDPNSLYSLLASSQAAKNSQNSVNTCVISRIGQPQTITEDIGYDVSFFVGYDSNGSTKECFWATETYQCKDIFELALGWTHCKDTVKSNISTIVKGLIPSVANASCVGMEIKSDTDPVSPHPGCYGSGDNSTHQFLHVWCYTRLPHEGAEVFPDLPLLREKRDDYTESVIDGCSALAHDGICPLVEMDRSGWLKGDGRPGDLPECRGIGQQGLVRLDNSSHGIAGHLRAKFRHCLPSGVIPQMVQFDPVRAAVADGKRHQGIAGSGELPLQQGKPCLLLSRCGQLDADGAFHSAPAFDVLGPLDIPLNSLNADVAGGADVVRR